jgi:MoaA/NifB/PqqE/SkfB family radical SAM enzyme
MAPWMDSLGRWGRRVGSVVRHGLPRDFDAEAYLLLNPDVASAGVGPRAHYALYGRAEGRRFSRRHLQKSLDVSAELLAPAPAGEVRVDLTTRCNLRCTYCAVSQIGYVGEDMTPEVRAAIREQVLDISDDRTLIVVNGHGETTFLPDWVQFVGPLLAARRRVTMLSNLSKVLDEAELAAFARLAVVSVSIDSFDPELLRGVRRSVTPDRIQQNIARIRQTAAAAGLPGPEFHISSGLYDKNALGLVAFADEAIRLGVKSVVFWNLVKYPDVEGGINVQPLDALAPAELHPRLEVIDRAAARLRANGVLVAFTGDFVNVLRRRERARAAVTVPVDTNVRELPAGMTRNCLDPWNNVEFRTDGSVALCCIRPPIGSMATESLQQVLNGPAIRGVRKGLLEGRPDELCRKCHVRPPTVPSVLQERVAALAR